LEQLKQQTGLQAAGGTILGVASVTVGKGDGVRWAHGGATATDVTIRGGDEVL